MKINLDHIVVVANTLEQGVQWCEATLGITPAPGGEHIQFGTHNRLFKIATPTHPLAYFEIIAIQPGAKGPANPHAKRWFDMDDPMLRAAIVKEPRLAHFVVNTDDMQAARVALKKQNIEPGVALHASRHSRKGVLHWQITVREDGKRLFDGALPALIQWGKHDDADPMRLHPRNSLPRSGVTLQSIAVTHPTTPKLQTAYDAIGLTGIDITQGDANVAVTLNTPKGTVTLQSHIA
jgi:Glyoxalase-like domain